MKKSVKAPLLAIGLAVCTVFGTPEPLWAYSIKPAHPRLIADKATLTSSAGWKADVDALKTLLEPLLSKPVLKLAKDRQQALLYAKLLSAGAYFEGDGRYFKKAKEIADDILRSPYVGLDDYPVNQELEALAYFYDLCFDRIDEKDRAVIRDAIFVRVKWLEVRIARLKNFGGSHASYANRTLLKAAAAVHGEADWAQATLDLTLTNFKDGFMPFFKYIGGEDGGFHMGWEYSRYYIFGILDFMDVWRNVSGENLFEENRWVEKTALFLIYGLRDDRTYWGAGDNHSRNVKEDDRVIFSKMAAEYGNGRAQWMADHLDKFLSESSPLQFFYRLVWRGAPVPPQPPGDLPLTKVFKRIGAHLFRQGWEDDNVSALFRCSPIYFFNHAHRDLNSFEIWYKDDLAIDSGYYDSYESKHWFNYYIRTIAHNTVLFFDPQEKLADWDKIESNDGGQRFSQSSRSQPYDVRDLQDPAFQIGESTLLEDNENYSLAVGDATKAYSPHKCELFKRYFLFLRKVEGWNHPVIVVYDRVVSTQDSFEKIWLLHSIREPKIKDREITIENGGGKLRAVVVKPEALNLRAVGGPGREFEVNGVNYPPNTKKMKDVQRWAGAWRMELRPKNPAKEAEFLTVLMPADAEQAAFPALEAVPSGFRIGQWDVLADENGLRVQLHA